MDLRDQRMNRVSETRRAKLFTNGASEAVRLPAEFRFDTDEVFIRRDDATGDVLLSSKPGARIWADFFELMETIDIPDDVMAERPMNRTPKAVPRSLDRHPVTNVSRFEARRNEKCETVTNLAS